MYLFHQFHDFFLCRSSEVFYLLLLTCVHLVIGSQSQCGDVGGCEEVDESLAGLHGNKLLTLHLWRSGGVGSAAVLEAVGCVCTVAVCPVIVSPQTVGELSEKHLTVHIVGADVCLLWRQTAAGHQLAEGLTGEGEFKSYT